MRAPLARTLFAAAIAAAAAALVASACNPNTYEGYTLGGPGDGSGGSGGGQSQQGAGGGGSEGAGGGAGLGCEGEGQEACNNAACQNCDADGAGSCETDTSISSAHCGVCGHSCLTTTCSNNQCQSASVTSGVQISTRLVSGGGYLYWVSTPEQIDTLPGDSVYRIDVANGGQAEQAYVPADALKIFDLAANSTGFYLVTNQGVKTRAHGATGPLTPLAAEQNPAFAELTAPALARISANETDVFFTAPLEGNTAQVWSVPAAGGAAKALATIDSGEIAMLVADAGGVFVGSGVRGAGDPGVSYVPNVEGGAKSTVYNDDDDVVVSEFAVSGDDLLIVDTGGFYGKLVATNRVDKVPVVLLEETPSQLHALAGDPSGLYYLDTPPRTAGDTALMRVRREPGANALGAPTKLLDDVPGAALNVPLALDAGWVYGASSGGTGIFHVPK